MPLINISMPFTAIADYAICRDMRGEMPRAYYAERDAIFAADAAAMLPVYGVIITLMKRAAVSHFSDMPMLLMLLPYATLRHDAARHAAI